MPRGMLQPELKVMAVAPFEIVTKLKVIVPQLNVLAIPPLAVTFMPFGNRLAVLVKFPSIKTVVSEAADTVPPANSNPPLLESIVVPEKVRLAPLYW